MRELISVCMPVYNRADQVLEAAYSILNQDYSSLELIIVDDGSTDETAEVVSSIKDSRVRLIRLNQNQGNIACRNVAFKAALGDFIAIMDSDDVACPWRLSMQASTLKRGFDICGGYSLRAPTLHSHGSVWRTPRHQIGLKRVALFGSPFANSSAMITRSFLERTNFRYDPTSFPAADYAAWSAAVFNPDVSVAVVDKVVLLLRKHGNTISATHEDAQALAAAKIREGLLRKLGINDGYLIDLHNKIAERRTDHMGTSEYRALADLYFERLPQTGDTAFKGSEAERYFEGHLSKIAHAKPTSWRRAPAHIPDVSVIVAAYNVAPFLNECLCSALRQEDVSVEVIVVNDGSTDDTECVCESITDSRLKLISQPNQGLSVARNTGTSAANGRYVYFLDGDDFIEPNALSIMVAKADSTNVDVVVAGHSTVDSSGEVEVRFGPEKDSLHKNSILHAYVERCFGAPACNKLIKACLAKRLPFKPGILHEDELFCPSLFSEARSVAVLATNTYWYRQRPGSITEQVTPKHLEDWCVILFDSMNLIRSRNINGKERRAFMKRLRRLVSAARRKLYALDNPDKELVKRVQNVCAEANALILGERVNSQFATSRQIREANEKKAVEPPADIPPKTALTAETAIKPRSLLGLLRRKRLAAVPSQ
ncbi:glycosyltransferase family 2 protein [Methyloceanibacter caenitepidi]|uniref:Glycosyltransferase n=1 Tax=Methyloceanibacter caenitepidi TaxID=1384459 RepID=A0A0A8K5M0_9HYPH|nr:glycosyltransferase [Methyloceanibacter caenitepidi]BAQ18243.1 glycosyltransferase [Methyloceanibacter caenitepidi]